MPHSSIRTKILVTLLLISSTLSIAAFAYRNHQSFYQTPIDFLIFLRAGEAYKETGQLYQRSDNYTDTYHPSAAIFKFPPAFQLMLMPLVKLPADMNLHVFTRLLLTGMYALSIVLLFFYLKKKIKLHGLHTFYFASLLIIIGCWFMPFFESIRWLLTEIPLLLLFIISFLLLTKNKWLAGTSAALIAYAASAKIYPFFLFGHHLLQKSKSTFWGFLLGLIITLIASLYYFGLSEHLFYIKNILPVLMNEQVSDKWVNLNLEKFLFIIGIIPDISGHIFQITRLFFVGGLLALLYFSRNTLSKNEFLIFSLFITTMFFCFPNYWPQYQIFLIIPIATLIAIYIKTNKLFSLMFVCMVTSLLFVPDLLWQTILDWDSARNGLDIETIGKESYLNGTGVTLLKYSPLTWLMYYSYEYRAVAPVALWFLLTEQIRKNP